jgi:thiosulfate/3-mercaptopyruvate sulfurtransferase
MPFNTLVSAEMLAEHLNDPNWLVFDCRFDLVAPDWGYLNYQSGHIPGAVYVHLNDDLSGPVTPKTGRHPLPETGIFASKIDYWGISPGKQVIVYDQGGGSFAGRLWWMLRASGHDGAALLDGGLPKWLADNYPISIGVEIPRAHSSWLPEISFDQRLWVKAEEVLNFIQDPKNVLIDARAPERFSGEVEPIDPIAGHIPGAVNRFNGLDLNPDGTFKSPEVLREEFLALLKGTPPENAIIYCGSGVTSCHLLAAMEIAGLKGARLYAGSWSEWIRDPDRPLKQ